METTTVPDRRQLDYQLVCDARDNGSGKAYASLMASYREPLYLLLLRMTRNTTTADDLTVETFSKAFLQLHRYAPTAAFSSWLFAIGVHTYIDHLRKRRLETVPLSELSRNSAGEFVEYPLPSPLPDPEEQLMLHQRDETLRQVVQQLKPAYRQVIELRYYEDLSYEEIADRLSLPLGTVKIRLSRAKQLLSATLRRDTSFDTNHF